MDTLWNRLLYGRRTYIAWGLVWRVVSTTEGASHYCDGSGYGLPETPPPTPTRTPDTEISPSDATKSMSPRPSSAAYTPPPSARRQCSRSDTPSQPFCLRWYGGPPCQKIPSGHPEALGAGPAWARREGCHRRKRTLSATGTPARSRPVLHPPPPPS